MKHHLHFYGQRFLVLAAVLLLPAAAHAQIRIDQTHGDVRDGKTTLCVELGGDLGVPKYGDDCDDATVTAHVLTFASGPNEIVLDGSDGSATFNGTTTFNGSTAFNGSTTFGGGLQAAGLTSTSGFTNTGGFTSNGSGTFTGSLSASSLSAGSGTFSGALSSSQLTTGAINASSLFATGGATVQGFFNAQNGAAISGTTQLQTARIATNLTVVSGATVNMGGNRVQGVGGPVAGTDAANKDYVDSAVAGVNAGLAQATADNSRQDQELNDIRAVNTRQDGEIAAAQTTANTARTEAAAAQATANTSITRGNNLGASTAAALGGGSTYNSATGAVSAPSYAIGGQSYNNVGSAFAAVDSQLSQLDARVDTLSASSDRRFHNANGGIAAAMALGGTMIVPDSMVSVNFNLATYRGEQGFSGAVVVRTSPRVYLSGAFAGSTVKGSTGGRVGIAFGF